MKMLVGGSINGVSTAKASFDTMLVSLARLVASVRNDFGNGRTLPFKCKRAGFLETWYPWAVPLSLHNTRFVVRDLFDTGNATRRAYGSVSGRA